ncbi:MAG TPA: hypothetical protein VGH45_07775, partial [Solirubrobacteraceae bacterium]
LLVVEVLILLGLRLGLLLLLVVELLIVLGLGLGLLLLVVEVLILLGLGLGLLLLVVELLILLGLRLGLLLVVEVLILLGLRLGLLLLLVVEVLLVLGLRLLVVVSVSLSLLKRLHNSASSRTGHQAPRGQQSRAEQHRPSTGEERLLLLARRGRLVECRFDDSLDNSSYVNCHVAPASASSAAARTRAPPA